MSVPVNRRHMRKSVSSAKALYGSPDAHENQCYNDCGEEKGTETIILTVGASPTNNAWAQHYGIEFPILADFWPHGEVSQKFGCFHEKAGIALRYSYITDENNVITEIIKSDEIGVERDFSLYKEKFGI